MIESYKRYWKQIGVFSGTASRPDYWWPAIINYVLGVIFAVILQNVLGHPMNDIYSWKDLNVDLSVKIIGFVVFIANWSVKVRRLHDTNRSGWWILIEIIPVIGWIWMFILMILPSKKSRWN
ncbi:hypothetical protein FC56_GL000228 [Lentilactobacillus senioris DSM 24302 = JCM 17472]|uniref:DUF805 domain-containing protein n=1 Tax=Lentilactobacillus senioris DSM 24302 = JCM 17472 TaxID=1423802 RepID=A0A0R2D0M3_9LACO|nr:DUF805 domain-containing protein [Lentilactobacillus senioris]KRM93516.1 hypothetical protein FC56_GL000228 [Lentilactobacillus senioris DSM 24302 = JCM 17472]